MLAHLCHQALSPFTASQGESKMSIGALDSEFRKLLNQVGLPTDALDSALGSLDVKGKLGKAQGALARMAKDRRGGGKACSNLKRLEQSKAPTKQLTKGTEFFLV